MALDPELVDAHLALGRVAAAQRRTRDAEAAFRAALRLDPECGLAHRQLACLRMNGAGNGRLAPSGAALGAAAAGFGTSLRTDPRAAQGRAGLELVVVEVAMRTSGILCFAALVGLTFAVEPASPCAASWTTTALLLFGVGFVVRFVRRLSPAVRTQLVRGLRRPWPGLQVAAFALAAVLLGLGAAAVPPVGVVAFTGALAVTLVAYGAMLRGHGGCGEPDPPEARALRPDRSWPLIWSRLAGIGPSSGTWAGEQRAIRCCRRYAGADPLCRGAGSQHRRGGCGRNREPPRRAALRTAA